MQDCQASLVGCGTRSFDVMSLMKLVQMHAIYSEYHSLVSMPNGK